VLFSAPLKLFVNSDGFIGLILKTLVLLRKRNGFTPKATC